MGLCAAGAFVVGAISGFAAEITVVDEIIAKVNGEIITRSDVEKTRVQLEEGLKQQGLTGLRLTDAIKTNEKNILREKIDTILLVSKAKESNISCDTEVAKQLADIQKRTNIADPEKFQEAVRNETGQTYEDYRNEMKNQCLVNRVVRQEVSGHITFKREDLEKYYKDHQSEFNRDERVFLREILVSMDPKDQASLAAADKKSKDLVARGRKGEKFDEIAQANSDSPSAQQGGDIGSYEKGKLRGDIEKAIWDQPRGYVTDPINVGNGYLILKVEDHQKAGLASFEEVQPEITNRLFQPRMQPELRKYLTQLRTNAFLEIKPGFEDTGAAPGKDTAWVDPAEIKPDTVSKEEVLSQARRKKLLGIVPIPGTTAPNTGTSSSR
jgi:parvulin-like peptidyl-prolyl isomerase